MSIYEQSVLLGETSINIEAPIILGKSAADIRLGSSIEEVLKEQNNHFISEEVIHPTVHFPTITRYRSVMVDLWAKNGIVFQVMVHNGYQGKLIGTIGLGSTIADIEKYIGPVEDDDEDNLVLQGLSGVGIEIEGYFSSLADPALRNAPIRDI